MSRFEPLSGNKRPLVTARGFAFGESVVGGLREKNYHLVVLTEIDSGITFVELIGNRVRT